MGLLLFLLAWWGLGAWVSFLFFSEDKRVTDRMVIVILFLCVPFGVLLPIGLSLVEGEIDENRR